MSNLAVVALARAIKDVDTAKAVAASWKLSNDDVKQLVWTVESRDASWDIDLAKALITGDNINREWIYDLLRSLDLYDIVNELRNWETPKFPINGNDLIQSGNYRPGPEIGHELARRKGWWINSNFTMTRDELLSYL